MPKYFVFFLCLFFSSFANANDELPKDIFGTWRLTEGVDACSNESITTEDHLLFTFNEDNTAKMVFDLKWEHLFDNAFVLISTKLFSQEEERDIIYLLLEGDKLKLIMNTDETNRDIFLFEKIK